MNGRSAFRAAPPRLAPDADPILAELCLTASGAVDRAWASHDREALLSSVGVGADGTSTYLLDQLVEEPLIEAADRLGVNLLSEEVGFIDRGHARTAVVDPLDGSANAASGVPLSCFSAALVEGDRAVSALTCWLENGATVSATTGRPTSLRTSGRRALDGAALGLLRPKDGPEGDSTPGWLALADRAERVRILSSSCLESMLVAQGAIDAFADPGSDTHRIVDLAAAMVLVPAAGGHVADVHGRPLEFDPDLTRRWSGVVGATEAIVEQICQTVRGSLPRSLGAVEASGVSFGLRRARRDDLAAIRDLLDRTAVSPGAGEADWPAIWRRIDRNPNTLLIVATDPQDRIVATVQYSLQQTIGYRGLLRAEVEGLAVHPELRGRGLGRAIIDWIVRRATDERAGVVQLTSNRQRADALRFYEGLGFVHSHAGMKLTLQRP